MRFLFKRWSILPLFFVSQMLLGQSASNAANDCENAVVVCGNNQISSNVSGPGRVELVNNGGDCFLFESNSIWLEINVTNNGTLSFTITPDSPDLFVDYDFNLFGPSSSCGNLGDPIRCSTTNPLAAGLTENTTGLRDEENDNSEGPGMDGNSFVSTVNALAGERYLLVVDRPIGDGGFSLDFTGTADFSDPPVLDTTNPDDLEFCILTSGDLIDLSPTVLTISSDPNTVITVHPSNEEAFDGENEITQIDAYPVVSQLTTLVVRAENAAGCFELIEFSIVVDEFIEQNTLLQQVICSLEGNSTAFFSLDQIQFGLEGLLTDPNNFDFTVHDLEIDAENGVNALMNDPIATNNTMLFGRINCTAESGFAVIPIEFSVVPLEIPEQIALLQCDVDQTNSTDGLAAFNLNEAFTEFLGLGAIEFSLFETIADRNMNQPIENPIGYRNQTPFAQTLFYRLLNNEVGCQADGEVLLTVQPTTVSINPQSPFLACDDNLEDDLLSGLFDLELIRQTNYPNLEVNFYQNLEDLTVEQNALNGFLNTESTALFVRIENANQCQGVEEIELLVNPSPDLIFPDQFFLCLDNPPLLIEGPLGFDSYSWVQENASNVLSTDQNVSIQEPGNYTLEVGFLFEINGQIQECTTSASFEVLASSLAVIENVEVSDLTNGNSIDIEVSGEGDYEFSIDGINFQDTPFFENVPGGFVTVFVRDVNGCGTSSIEVGVIDFPRFFTPNGDSFNEFWQIIGAQDLSGANLQIQIFDRFGKLLSVFSPNDPGWDGTFKGNELPSSDYWFLLTFEDGRRFRGHFTLKR